jgi:hypothetical protein
VTVGVDFRRSCQHNAVQRPEEPDGIRKAPALETFYLFSAGVLGSVVVRPEPVDVLASGAGVVG